MSITTTNKLYGNQIASVDVASRTLAAVLGGYALTQVASILLAAALRGDRAEGVLAALLLSFAIYTIAIIWCFATRSATRAWLGVMLSTAVLTLPAWWAASSLSP